MQQKGLPLEDLLTATTGVSDCPSCSFLTGSATSCRTVQCGGESFEELTPELIRKGIEAVLVHQHFQVSVESNFFTPFTDVLLRARSPSRICNLQNLRFFLPIENHIGRF